MKKQILVACAILLGFAVVAVVLVLLRSDPAQRPPEVRTPLVQTIAADVRQGALWVDGAGTVEPLEEVALAPEVGGKVVYVHPSLIAGGRVRRGEVLIRIDPSGYQNAVEAARADVAQQEVALIEEQEEAEIARAEYEEFTSRETRRALSPYASVDTGDYAARIYAARIRPPEGLERAPGRARAEVAAEVAAEDSTRSAPSRLTLRGPQLRAAEAALSRAEAQLADAERALERTAVQAPFTGVVRSENVAPGAYVATGQSLAEIVASEAAEVVVPLTRDAAALIPDLWTEERGRPAARVYADYGGVRYQWDGYVDRAEAVLNPETRTIDVRVRVPDPRRGGQMAEARRGEALVGVEAMPGGAPPLLIGEFVQVEIEGVEVERYITVPRRALRTGDDVWVVEDSTLRVVPVEVVQEAGEVAHLRASEITSGQPIIVSGLRVVTNGMRVRLPDEVPQPSPAQPSLSEPSPSASSEAARLSGNRSPSENR